MTENREIAEYIFDRMRGFGFKPYDVKYVSECFGYGSEKDNIVDFKIKGVWKNWEFSMFLTPEYLKEKYREEEKDLSYYHRYALAIIHVKYEGRLYESNSPYRKLELKILASDWEEKFGFLQLEDMLKMIRRHPFICYVGQCGNYAGYNPNSYILEFIRYEGGSMIQGMLNGIKRVFWLNWTRIKCHFAKKDKCVHSIEIYDFEKENPDVKPDYRYKVNVVFAEDSTQDEEIRWVNKWFWQDEYSPYDNWKHVIKLGWFRRIGKDEEYSYK